MVLTNYHNCAPFQIATLIATAYFTMTLFSRQFLHGPDTLKSGEANIGMLFLNSTIEYGSISPFDKPDIYIPIFYLVEFMCMFGWLKVAETMLNPFGEDDADFDCNYLIDRNLAVSYLIVDEAGQSLDIHPDPFLGSESGIPMPAAAAANGGARGSANKPEPPEQTPMTEQQSDFSLA